MQRTHNEPLLPKNDAQDFKGCFMVRTKNA